MFTITNREFDDLTSYIKEHYGIRLGQEKKLLVLGRLGSLLNQHGFSSFTEYYDYVVSDKTGRASAVLISLISTNHTFFMREADHFDYFRDKVLPFWAEHAKDRDLRIWSAGCSSGEEPYTLSMIIDEFFGVGKERWDTQLLATDISEKALSLARRGIYHSDAIVALPPQWRVNYFRKTDIDFSGITDRIKKEVIFRRLNLMDAQFPFKKKFHAIFCRNVMIYFDSVTRKKLVDKFYNLTEPGGYLFVGHAESLNQNETCYQYIQPAVYRKERY